MIKNKICVIGLGYVGLPIFIQLSKYFSTYGYDINKKRIKDLKDGNDKNNEFKRSELKKNSKNFLFDLKNEDFNFYIVTVPTPIFANKKPDLNPLKSAIYDISKKIKREDIVIIESTVYPGVTEDICAKILKKKNLYTPKDFIIGYSPERINPGDKKHELGFINKIISINSNNRFIKKRVKQVYEKISKKLIFTKSIKEAETAKAIENIQRDLNIGFINEIYKFCEVMKLNFNEVIRLARTKWNFMSFSPGLVGGHCLPVDPYYLSYIARKNRMNMKILLAGREVNNSMKKYLIKQIKKRLFQLKYDYKKKRLIFLGITYKPNVSDIRNSLALDIVKHFIGHNKNVKFYDPIANLENKELLKHSLENLTNSNNNEIFIILVKHKIFKKNKKILKSKNLLKVFE